MSATFRDTGYSLARKPIVAGIILYFIFIVAILIAKKGISLAVIFLVLPGIVFAMVKIISSPRLAILVAFCFSFFVSGLARYMAVPWGLATDFLLLIGLGNLFLLGWKETDWSPAKYYLTTLSLIWMGYAFFELVNPEAVSPAAWFYAMRGVAFYQIMVIPLAALVFNKLKDLDLFFKIWMLLSLVAFAKGFQQISIGPDPFEQRWLDAGGHITHILFGKLRAFSFYDAGTFGALMAMGSTVAGIIAIGPGRTRKRLFFGALSVINLIGMFISGTRGALAVPAMGFILFLLLSRNFKIFAVGVIFGILVFGFLKFTTIANDNYQIRRMRTALDPNDASLQVRLENQKKLKIYLASRPFGGGIGSAGNWGLRFSPNTFLAQTPTDSWYVKIWAEMGVIGLLLHLFILFYILIKSSAMVWKRLHDLELIFIMLALISGYFGIMAASYGNGILGQMPISMILMLSWSFVYFSPKLQSEKLARLPENDNLFIICNDPDVKLKALFKLKQPDIKEDKQEV
jgi:hypothetical protein